MGNNITSIVYDGKDINLFYHPYNCGDIKSQRTVERTVELAISIDWMGRYASNVVEIGAVTPYYFPGMIDDIIDPYDKHPLVTQRKSIFDANIRGKNILSISTIEHIGTDDYGSISKSEDSIQALKLILREAAACLITFPCGYNRILDEYVSSAKFGRGLKKVIYYRSATHNDWKNSNRMELIRDATYGPNWANAVVVLEK